MQDWILADGSARTSSWKELAWPYHRRDDNGMPRVCAKQFLVGRARAGAAPTGGARAGGSVGHDDDEGGDSDDGEVDDEGELRIWTVTDERGHNHASGVYRALH